MDNYPLYLTVAAAAILSPGPGVTLTLTNALRFRLLETMAGIAGVAVGAMVVAAISASGVGLLLATSSVAFDVMKYIGAAYLIFLGVKMWRSTAKAATDTAEKASSGRVRFFEGLSLQFSNPKAIFFFISIFPQFIGESRPYALQFTVLVLPYGLLVVLIHLVYALTASSTKQWLSSPLGRSIVNKLGGAAFIVFGIMLANSNL
ncbi:MAG: LysE family translocator [Bacteroidetes bacterium]|nr:LysE family translocator [Bacteroidota bacterium]MCW5894158.1 LysE family translocator [Bacteroidota bacterium]